jgi:protein ImuB
MLALWFPYLATDRILRGRLGRHWRVRKSPEGDNDHEREPLVVSHRDANAQRIFAFCEKGRSMGLRTGLGIADLKAMHPGIEVIEADEDADRRLLTGIADWCDRYTPLVALAGEDGLFLDITGCAHLFGGEKSMLEDVTRRLVEQGICVRAGLASTPGMAWAAARYLDASFVEHGKEAQALAGLPLAALRLEPSVCASLASVGLRTVETIMRAPRAPLARRFGSGLLMRLDQALGEIEEAVSPRLPVAPLSAERHLMEPVVLDEDIERLVFLLAGTLKEDLERRGEGARKLQLALFRVDGVVKRISVGASRPLREPSMVLRLFRERLSALGGVDADCGFELARLSLVETARFEQEQVNLHGKQDGGSADLTLFADRIRARLGSNAVMAAQLVESHLPERAVAAMPFVAEYQTPAPVMQAVERPVRLLPHPEPVDVAMAEVPDGPPQQFRWRRVLYRVARAEGPERIASEWWRGGDHELPTRDYFRIEDDEGRRFWIYRLGLYGQSQEMPRWYLHGLFA